jgi:hypothetical protein
MSNFLSSLIKLYPNKTWEWNYLINNPSFTVYQVLNLYKTLKELYPSYNFDELNPNLAIHLKNPNTTYQNIMIDIEKYYSLNKNHNFFLFNSDIMNYYNNWVNACNNPNFTCHQLWTLIKGYPTLFNGESYYYSYYISNNPHFNIKELERIQCISENIHFKFKYNCLKRIYCIILFLLILLFKVYSKILI